MLFPIFFFCLSNGQPPPHMGKKIFWSQYSVKPKLIYSAKKDKCSILLMIIRAKTKKHQNPSVADKCKVIFNRKKPFFDM